MVSLHLRCYSRFLFCLRLGAVALLLIACLSFGVSCATCRKPCGDKPEVSGEVTAEPADADAADDEIGVSDDAAADSKEASKLSLSDDVGAGRNSGMVRFVGGTPVEIMQKALADKDADSIRVVVFNALTLDFVMPDGRTVRQSILDTGDSRCIEVIKEAESRTEDPRVLR